jgi:hypothetical protein
MVGDNHLQALGPGVLDGLAGGNSAIDGDDQTGPHLGHAVQPGFRETVALDHPVRNEIPHIPLELAQVTDHQGDRGNPVDIVVAVDHDFLSGLESAHHPADRRIHPLHHERIEEIVERRVEKFLDHFGAFKTPVGKELTDQGVKAELLFQTQNPLVAAYRRTDPAMFQLGFSQVHLSPLV